jgi:hypothetical protein
LLVAPAGVVDHDRHIRFVGHLVPRRRDADAQGHAPQPIRLGHAAELFGQAGRVVGDDIGAQASAFLILAGRLIHFLVDLLDQTGQGVAHFANENQSDQVGVVRSHRAAPLAGEVSRHDLRKEPVAIIPGPHWGTRFQRHFGRQRPGEQGGKRNAGHEACGHEEMPFRKRGEGEPNTSPACPASSVGPRLASIC